MGLIHVLDTEVSNKIAAGEVVERPLSIVKELIENSIDAGANVITVEIRDGGVSYIRVTDNGCGMSDEDAKICFLRHATSKIQTGSDLEAIYTLGFRGEALSSIGAVAKVKLYTKRREDSIGVCVTCEGGEILSLADAGAPDGTVIEVCDLFYNTPARLKFLKKGSTEGGYISDIISRYVFAHPEISFKLIRDGKEVIFSSGDNNLINAIYAVYGKDYAKNMLNVDFEFNGIKVKGVIGKGTLTRANRNYETFFVNKRYIKSAVMIRALEEAYKNQIMISKFPTAILNIELDPSEVDINVHPTKLECKFSDEQTIYQAVYHAAKNALYALPNVPEIRSEMKEESKESFFKAERGEQKTLEEIYSEKLRQSLKPSNDFKFKTEKREVPKELNKSEFTPAIPEVKRDITQIKPAIAEQKPAMPEVKPDVAVDTASSQTEAFMKMMAKAKEVQEKEVTSEENKTDNSDMLVMIDEALANAKYDESRMNVRDSEVKRTVSEQEWNKCLDSYFDKKEPEKKEEKADSNLFTNGTFRVIGQLFETYILVEKENKLLLIDQHAAHERLNFESLKEEVKQNGVISQMILEPVEIKLSGTEAAVYKENEALFAELGFECVMDENETVVISSVPGDIGWSEIEPLFLELLTQVSDFKQQVIAADKERLLYTISCKASVKANMAMSEIEMTSLVERVFRLENINTCPHGRPIVISMTKTEIEKQFRRIV